MLDLKGLLEGLDLRAKGRTVNEVRALYGLHDPAIPSQRANEIVYSVFQLFGKSVEETIFKDEFVRLLESGGDLVDAEFDGHHGDDEWEVRPFKDGINFDFLASVLMVV
jgi:hypothetical protein